jgi:hypothetical protein
MASPNPWVETVAVMGDGGGGKFFCPTENLYMGVWVVGAESGDT